MTQPLTIRTLRYSVRFDDAGITSRSWFVTHNWSWSEIAAVGWDDATEGLRLLAAVAAQTPMGSSPRRCLHIAILGDEFVKEITCVRYEPSSVSDRTDADRARIRNAVGDWADRFPRIADSGTPFQEWWIKQLRATTVVPESDEQRIARIRADLDRMKADGD